MNILRPIQKEFYGDDYRWFFGTVINAQPPAGLEGRVKVRINGVHNPNTDEIPERDLPWAQVMIPTTEPGISGYGRIPQLAAGSFVFGIFLDGISSQIPLVMGSLPRVEFPSNIQLGRVGVTETTTRLQNSVTDVLLDDELAEPTSIQLRRQQCMKFFLDNGYEPIHAAAITGGLEVSSRFKTYGNTGKTAEEQRQEAIDNATSILDLRGIGSFSDIEGTIVGIASWNRSQESGSRWNGLLSFAQSFEPVSDWRLFSIQLQYVLYELRNRFGSANRRLLNTTDIKEASSVFNSYYLLSGAQTEAQAQTAYDEVFAR